MLKKTALITGVSGQDGRLMSDYLLKNSYSVVGLSQSKTPILEHNNYNHKHCDYKNKKQISDIVREFKPEEIYHFAANSFPGTSSSEANQLIEDNVSSFTNIVNSCIEFAPQSRFFNASSAYIFKPQKEIYTLSSEHSPVSPYGVSKLLCHEMATNLREQKKYFLVNGILFNHESIYRDERFVTVKIIKQALEIKKKSRDILELGNINVIRDWSHAKDFIPAIHKSLKAETAKDYIFSSGKGTTLQSFIDITFQKLELNMNLVVSKNELLRETDYSYLVGDNAETVKDLGLRITHSVDDIISELIQHYT